MTDPPPTETRPDPDDRLTESEAYRRMYRVSSDYDRPFEEKVRDFLEIGCQFLGVSAGFLTKIENETQYIVQAYGDHPLLQSGKSCPLEKSYCRKTVTMDETLTVQHAQIEGWEDDSAYETFGLESYIGARVVVDGELYGSFCFADTVPREEPFTQTEETFVELMAEWIRYELFTKQATARLQEQRDQLQEYTSMLSHDLRNPLGVAKGYIDLAEETGDPADFQRVRDALEQMDALIDDVLMLTRGSETDPDGDVVQIETLVRECWDLVPTAEATLAIETDAAIVANGKQLQQLVANLFRNAVEHGGDDITVRVGTLTDGTGFYIEDDGQGIPPGERDQIFDDGFSTSDEGTGLGLTVVERVVNAHGWDMTVTESETGGARFEITGVEFAAE